MELPKIKDEELQLFVFGPGTGELVVARAPPGNWLVVDGCSAGGVAYGPRLLQEYKAHPSVIVLTHPHLDHARGVAALVEDSTQGPPETWPRLGLLFPPTTPGAGARDNPQLHFDAGVTEQAVAAIFERWRQNPACRWDVREGDVEPLGDAALRVLSPTAGERQDAEKAWRDHTWHNWNRASTALCLEWGGHRIVLGSDLVEDPGEGWTSALRVVPDLHRHVGWKVPHHGSSKALHIGVLKGGGRRPAPSWIVTPFASRNLPRFTRGEGIDRMHKAARQVLLTALPREHALQAKKVTTTSRTALARGGAGPSPAPSAPAFPDCYIAVSFRAGKKGVTVERGPGSWIVTR